MACGCGWHGGAVRATAVVVEVAAAAAAVVDGRPRVLMQSWAAAVAVVVVA